MSHLLDHPQHGGRLADGDTLSHTRQPEPAQRSLLTLRLADRTGGQRDLHQSFTHVTHARSSSTVLRRRAATCSDVRSSCKAATVALTVLCGLLEPIHLVSTLRTPANSTTARTPPPAITPVPLPAGRNRTCPAPKRPWTSYGIVPSMMGTLTR